MGYTTGLWLREKAMKKDGNAPIYLRVIIDRHTKWYHTNQFVQPKDWEGFQVKSRHPLSLKMNNILSEIKFKADTVLVDLVGEKQSVNFENFESRFKDERPQNFYDFATELITRNSVRYSESFHYAFLCEITKMKKFRDPVNFSDITLDFIEKYEHHMRTEAKNGSNTVAKTMKRLKYLVKQAIIKGYLRKNPFDGYSVAKEPTNREFLSMTEVEALENLYKKKLNPGMKDTLQAFLFCCYTGIRYQDVCDLTFADIRDGALYIQMHKTKDLVIVPLTEKALKLIPEQSGREKVFTVYTNQKCNVHLKAIAIMAEIEKNLTFHVSRHTFATISLNLGIPMEVVSKLLGHTDMKVTQVYAKIIDGTKFEQMKKWDVAASDETTINEKGK